jgi:hypothetical protein
MDCETGYTIWRSDMMRTDLICGVLLLTGCTDPSLALSTPVGPFAIAVASTGSPESPMIAVTIENRSEETWCIDAEALRNPWSHSMDLKMRDRNGRLATIRDPGYVAPPIAGEIRIESGKVVRGEYHFNARFKRIRAGRPIPKGMQIQASFRYGPCEAPRSSWAKSPWVPI